MEQERTNMKAMIAEWETVPKKQWVQNVVEIF